MEAMYNERIQRCKTEQEIADYILLCIPVIREYTNTLTVSEDTVRREVGGVQVSTKKGVQRNDIYKKYLREVEYQDVELDKVKNVHQCSQCKSLYTKILDDVRSDLICTNCGTAEYFLSEEVGFKEEQEMEKNIVYSYKRENHFNEWISQFQAKESTSVPPEVIEQLRSEFRKQKIKDLSEITHEKVKGLLKKLGRSKYYEHVPYIATILSGITPPTMPQKLEDKLRLMFHKIQAPFEKHKPGNRKNFLSYSYVLYKFCELLGEDEYLPCFPLLKSKEKLYIQDKIWKGICVELEWEFYKTI
jgi:hypothetical protein